jgi:hypothetical protein
MHFLLHELSSGSLLNIVSATFHMLLRNLELSSGVTTTSKASRVHIQLNVSRTQRKIRANKAIMENATKSFQSQFQVFSSLRYLVNKH